MIVKTYDCYQGDVTKQPRDYQSYYREAAARHPSWTIQITSVIKKCKAHLGIDKRNQCIPKIV
jgi:hypothetical protein